MEPILSNIRRIAMNVRIYTYTYKYMYTFQIYMLTRIRILSSVSQRRKIEFRLLQSREGRRKNK